MFIYLSVACTLYITLGLYFLLIYTFKVYQPEVQAHSLIFLLLLILIHTQTFFFLGWQQSLVLWSIHVNKTIT